MRHLPDSSQRWEEGENRDLADALGCFFVLILLGVATFWGVVIWAIIKIVNHYT